MDSVVDMILSDENPSEISDKIKEILYTKAAERVEAMKPYVAASVFGSEVQEEDTDEDEDEEYDENKYEDEDEDDEEE